MIKENPLKTLTQNCCFSVTGSDPFVLRACMKYAREHDTYFICEATVNQVNQFGGYTGMKPKDYANLVRNIAEDIGFPIEKLIISGDHLGPFTWKHLVSETAMAYSKDLVREYVAAGFRKIHLDPTMPLADDDSASFGDELIASRAAQLAIVSEETYEKTKNDTPWPYRPVYVIGSEVPVPGGTEEVETMNVTRPEALEKSILCFKNAFLDNGLPQVWEDTAAVVAQIGLEFSEENVYDFDYEKAKPLADKLRKFPPLVFESHSSDYQTSECIIDMVRDSVGILKVGPELTYQYREGLFALSKTEDELAPAYGFTSSHFIDVLEHSMLTATPNYWEKYYHGTPEELTLKRKYGFSDRSRYYFTQPEVTAAREQLLRNLSSIIMPISIISQYLPEQYHKIRAGKLENNPISILEDKCQAVQDRYYQSMLEAKRECGE